MIIQHCYPKEYGRINYNAELYFSIVYDLFIKNITYFEKLNVEDILIVESYKNKLLNDYFVMTVFSVMTIEAFVNDYLAVCLTDDFFYNNLDKQNILQKADILFTIIWEDKLDKSGLLYKCLKELIKARNSFVHSKSKKIDLKCFEKHENRKKDILDINKTYICEILYFLQEAFNAIKVIFLFCKSVDEHDKNRFAMSNTMSCMKRKDSYSLEQIKLDVEKKYENLERKLKFLKKREKKKGKKYGNYNSV